MKYLITILFLFNSILLIAQTKTFNYNDLVKISKSKLCFQRQDGSINEYYGELKCTSEVNNKFEFTIGCGQSGDIISLLIKVNPTSSDLFDLYIEKGEKYYGIITKTDKKIGNLQIISENKIKGYVKFCFEKNEGCCGEEGEKFTLLKCD